MLKLSKRADYGLIALRHLAVHARDGSVSAKEIGGRYRIPVPLMSKVLQTLSREGLLKSEHGTRGGYRLAHDPGRISALDVIRAIDGPVILTSCFTEDGDCDLSERCTVREPLRRVHKGILNLLDNITITDLVDDDESQRETSWSKPEGRLYNFADQLLSTGQGAP
jgi:Rrf2 family protein